MEPAPHYKQLSPIKLSKKKKSLIESLDFLPYIMSAQSDIFGKKHNWMYDVIREQFSNIKI